MRSTILTLVSAIGLLLPLKASAQGTLQVSNVDQTPTGSAAIGSDAWIAQSFGIRVSDPNQYLLESAELLMSPASGDPRDFSVSIYTTPGNGVMIDLGSLSGVSDPVTGGVYTYSSSGIALTPGETYFVLITAATPVAQGSYTWSAANSYTLDGSWYINNIYLSSTDGSSWTTHVRQGVFQMAIYATVVPEPTTFTLAGLGLAALVFWRRKP